MVVVEMEGSGGGMDDVSLHIQSDFNQEILYFLLAGLIRCQCSISKYTE